MGESSIKKEKIKRLEKIHEFTTYSIVVFGLLIIQLPLPADINKSGVYLVSLGVVLFAFAWYRFITNIFQGMRKTFIESLAGTIGIFFIVSFTGGVESYFNFFYFLPVLSGSVYMPLRYSLFITLLTSLLIVLPTFGYIGTDGFPGVISLSIIQVWAVWLISSYGTFLSGEINLAQKKQEEIKLEEVREVEKLKDEFIFIISHELRSPITVIRGYLEILTRGPTSRLNEKTRAILEKAFSISNKLSNLVTILLEVARLETGKINFYIQDVSIEDIFEKVRYDLESEIKQKGIELSVSITRGLKAKFDQERLEEILRIVFGNAITYTPEFGRVKVDIKQTGDKVVLTVSDNGIGISGEKKARLFEKFFTEKTGLKESTIKGINIGMYVVKQLLTKLKGDIFVESKVGAGTKFTIEIPSVKSNDIKAIIFDAGGVLFNSAESLFKEPINYIARITGESESKVDKAYRDTIKECESQVVDKKELWDKIMEKLDLDLPYTGQDPIAEGFKKFEMDSGVFRSVSKLKQKYKVAIVSNANAVEAETKQAKSMYKKVDEVILSFKVGIRKPRPEIYEEAFRRLKVRPEEVVFIDNTSANVKEANELGMKGVLFKNPDQLKKELVRVGIDIKM